MEKNNEGKKLTEWQEWCIAWYEKGFKDGWDAALNWLCRIPLNDAIQQLQSHAEWQLEEAEKKKEVRP